MHPQSFGLAELLAFVAVFTLFHFLCVPARTCEPHRRSLRLCLVALLLSAWMAEYITLLVRDSPDNRLSTLLVPFAFILILLSQVEKLWPYGSQRVPSWYAFAWCYLPMMVCDVVSITRRLTASGLSPAELDLTIVAGSRIFLTVLLFCVTRSRNIQGTIRLGDDNNTQSPPSTHPSTARIDLTQHKVSDEILKAGGYWRWLKKFEIFKGWIMPKSSWAPFIISLLLSSARIFLTLKRPQVEAQFLQASYHTIEQKNLNLLGKPTFNVVAFRLLFTTIAATYNIFWTRFQHSRKKHMQGKLFQHLMEEKDAAVHDDLGSEQAAHAAELSSEALRAPDSLVEDLIPQLFYALGAVSRITTMSSPALYLTVALGASFQGLGDLLFQTSKLAKFEMFLGLQQKVDQKFRTAIKAWRTVFACGQIQREIATFKEHLEEEEKVSLMVHILEMIRLCVQSAMQHTSFVSSTYLVAIHVIATGGTIERAIELRHYCELLSNTLAVFANLQHNFLKHVYAADRLRLVVEMESKTESGPKRLSLSGGRVELKNVTFRYSHASEKALFRRLNLTIGPGQTVGIVGDSGIGKTSILHLIMGMYVLEEGSILIDGQDIKELERGELQRHIAFMPQKTDLFDESFRYNISYRCPEASLGQIQEAAKMVGLHDEIMKRPLQYNDTVAADGKNLSGGQAQRLALACTLLKRPDILLLDEATSALDAGSEATVKKCLESYLAGVTKIIVAHRLGSIMSADVIIFLGKDDDGYVVVKEEGTHDELLIKNGAYARFWEISQGQTTERSKDPGEQGDHGEPEF